MAMETSKCIAPGWWLGHPSARNVLHSPQALPPFGQLRLRSYCRASGLDQVVDRLEDGVERHHEPHLT